MNEVCPVCGYNDLRHPPDDYTICPCCGTEFGYDDFDTPHEELRQRWINNGMRWWFEYDSPPENWNPAEQLERLEIRVTPPCERGA